MPSREVQLELKEKIKFKKLSPTQYSHPRSLQLVTHWQHGPTLPGLLDLRPFIFYLCDKCTHIDTLDDRLNVKVKEIFLFNTALLRHDQDNAAIKYQG